MALLLKSDRQQWATVLKRGWGGWDWGPDSVPFLSGPRERLPRTLALGHHDLFFGPPGEDDKASLFL